MKIIVPAMVLAIAASGVAGTAMAQASVEAADIAQHGDMAYRTQSPSLYLSATGDFNGDGREDTAVFLKAPEHRARAAVRFGQQKPSPVAIWKFLPAQSVDMKTDMPRMGLKTVGPGTYKTACGKGYGAADAKCVDEVTLAHDGIEIFTFEAASVLYVWNGKTFDTYSLSD